MGNRRRRRLKDDLKVLAIGGVIGYFGLEPIYGPWVVALLGAVVLMLWVLFVMPTKCDYDLGDRGCTLDVYGKLKGRYHHGRLKRDAIFAALRMQNPGLIFRVRWSDGSRSGRVLGAAEVADETTTNRARQGIYNMAMLGATVGGAIAGVLALFITR